MSTHTFVNLQTVGDPVAKAVFKAIADYADWELGTCWPSIKRLALVTEYGETTVRDKMKYLRDRGFISIEAREGKSHVLTILGYNEWVKSHPKRPQTPPPRGPLREMDPSTSRSGPLHVADPTPPGAGPELIIEHINKHNTPPLTPPQERATSADAWEASPPSPSKPSEVKLVSDEVENPSSSVVSLNTGVARETIKRVVARSEADKISTRDWPKCQRFSNPEGFASWTSWLEANGYAAQVHLANQKGVIMVPEYSATKSATELYKRKFPLANPASPCNDALSAKETA